MGEVRRALLANATTSVVTATTSALSFNANAGEIWVMEFFLTAQCGSTGGSKFQITAPAGAVVEGWIQSSTSAITTLSYQRVTAINTLNATALHTVANTPAPDYIRVRVKMGGNAGTVGLGFASVTATQVTTLLAGSNMIAYKVTEV